MVDLETPAVLAASDRLSMVSSARCECQGNVAVNGLRIGIFASDAMAETSRRNGANFSAMPVSVTASGMTSLRCVVCQRNVASNDLRVPCCKKAICALLNDARLQNQAL